jgi:hypothetical protein
MVAMNCGAMGNPAIMTTSLGECVTRKVPEGIFRYCCEQQKIGAVDQRDAGTGE